MDLFASGTMLRPNDHDVTGQVQTTDPVSVRTEIIRVAADLYGDLPSPVIGRAFDDVVQIYQGEFPGYRACDTDYHNLQHVLDVTLAMARLMDGYERGAGRRLTLGGQLFEFGVVLALFHDVGYIRREADTRHANGAEYTLTHVSRSGGFLQEWLGRTDLGHLAHLAARLVHFTGYEVSVDRIRVGDPLLRRIGYMLGSADIVAQMADRCYLEKCRDRLYPEFVLGGVARVVGPGGVPEIRFASGDDLVIKTPHFYEAATARLEGELQGMHHHLEVHFRGQNLYLEALQKNIRYAQTVADHNDPSLLRRELPAAHEAPLMAAQPQPRS
ncbi:MAG: hypothetical protein KIT73_08345, partial [Burkholderiales bacterium]|nr:hypothetical protein [Burkholderiales bacterium]